MEPRKSLDSKTLKNISRTKKDSPFLLDSSRPSIPPLPQSDVLQRLRGFLPQIAAANENMAAGTPMEFKVEHCVETSSDSDDSDSNSECSSSGSDEELEVGSQYVEMDINLFQAKDEVVGDASSEVQEVYELPSAFKVPEETPNGTETKVKKLIEEIEH